jgi:hypothetical protein
MSADADACAQVNDEVNDDPLAFPEMGLIQLYSSFGAIAQAIFRGQARKVVIPSVSEESLWSVRTQERFLVADSSE